MKLKRVCIFCGSSYGNKKEYAEAAVQLGHILFSHNIGLVYGGADVGLMSNIANTVHDNGGEVIGIIPRHLANKEIAHKGINDLRIVNSMHERKALMEKLSDAFIAMPGGFGTMDEIFEAITWAQLELHLKPCGFLNINGFYDKLFEFIDHAINEEFIKKEYRKILQIDNSPEGLISKLKNYRHLKVNKLEWAKKMKQNQNEQQKKDR